MVLRTHSRSSGNISSNLSAEKMPSLKRLRVFGWKPLDGKTAEGGLLFLINRPASCLWDCPNPRSLWFHSEWVWNLRHCRFIGSLFACLSSFLQWNCKWSDKLMNRLSLRGSGTRPTGGHLDPLQCCGRISHLDDYYDYLPFFWYDYSHLDVRAMNCKRLITSFKASSIGITPDSGTYHCPASSPLPIHGSHTSKESGPFRVVMMQERQSQVSIAVSVHFFQDEYLLHMFFYP